MEQPLYYWVPSIAPSGMTFLYSDIYPEWKGNLFVGSLSFEYLERVVLKKKYSGATRKSTCRYRSGTKRGGRPRRLPLRWSRRQRNSKIVPQS